jgi:membrane-bound metal-dependent hydrolase YbcI (DUF457 family)
VEGFTHALSGAVAGTATGLLVLHTGTVATADLALFGTGFATLSDLDSCSSTAARSLGFLSGAVSQMVRRISGGHRHATHSAVGIAVFTGLAYLACAFRHGWPGRTGLCLLLAIGLAAGLRALRIGGHFADALAIAGAGAVCWSGWHLALIPLATAIGCATHILGDMCTTEGCPLAWPLSMRHYGLPHPLSFTTGTWRETWIVTPALVLALGALVWHDASGAALVHHAHLAIGTP